MKRAAFALACLAGLSACAQTPRPPHPGAIAYIPTAENPVCAVTRVVDGDTVEITCRTDKNNARLMGFDTPETFRPGCAAERRLGETATCYLFTQLRQARVIGADTKGTDKYQRLLVEMTLDGKPLAQIMINRGVAVPYTGGKRINWCQRLAQS